MVISESSKDSVGRSSKAVLRADNFISSSQIQYSSTGIYLDPQL